MPVIATAGHVDHGKSTLVEALTGTDPDRLAEEKERGLTIDLGFAFGPRCAFVDVPGHMRFLKNMLAGVGAVDACLFVVAATEGWKAQSEEHLHILSLLGLRHGVVALTRARATTGDVDAVRRQVREHVAGSFLEGAEIVAVDAPAGVGLDELRAALDRLLDRLPEPSDHGRPRLWVDRSFSIPGAGAVVTGTSAGGTLVVGERLDILPSARTVRVRGLQSNGESSDAVGPGRRVAVNLAGISHRDVRRGDVLVRRHQWAPTRLVDCSFTAIGDTVEGRGAYLAFIGSGEHAVRVRPLADGCVRLHLPTLVPLVPGDRYVLRDAGRSTTVGGGEVLDVAPVLRAAKARPSRSVDRVVEERGWVDADELERLTGERRPPTVGRWVVAAGALAAAESALRDAIDDGIDVAGLDERSRAVLDRFDDVEVVGDRARRRGRPHPFVAALEAAPFAPPKPHGTSHAELMQLARDGLIVECDGIWFAASALQLAAGRVDELLQANPDGITVAQVRVALDTSRRYALSLLALLDAMGLTSRRGEIRVKAAVTEK